VGTGEGPGAQRAVVAKTHRVHQLGNRLDHVRRKQPGC
jgi:hypothetical protein